MRIHNWFYAGLLAIALGGFDGLALATEGHKLVLGEGDYSFTSDARGKGHYVATVPSAELAKWEIIEIAYHPDRDPTNMKNIGIALKANLPR